MDSLLEQIKLKVERPENISLEEAIFSFDPNSGGLYAQVLIVENELTLKDLLKLVFPELVNKLINSQDNEIFISLFILITILFFDSMSIHKLPDEYKSMLNLISNSNKGSKINLEKLYNIIKDENLLYEFLDTLVDKKILRKDRAGNYIIRKRVVKNISVSL